MCRTLLELPRSLRPAWFVTHGPPGRSTGVRDGPRRLPLIAVGSVGALIALGLVGAYVYHASGALHGFGESPAERVSLKVGDLPRGLTQCPVSGRPQDKGGATYPYGATDV